VVSTDIGPTILERFGLPIRPRCRVSRSARRLGRPGGIESRGARMAVISHRRGPVIGLSILAWVLASASSSSSREGRSRRPECGCSG